MSRAGIALHPAEHWDVDLGEFVTAPPSPASAMPRAPPGATLRTWAALGTRPNLRRWMRRWHP